MRSSYASLTCEHVADAAGGRGLVEELPVHFCLIRLQVELFRVTGTKESEFGSASLQETKKLAALNASAPFYIIMHLDDFSCPGGGDFYVCSEGPQFVGCCMTDPCALGCAAGSIKPTHFD